ncbi:hypothetical protein [Georgenia subflava]|uniref:Uncharacterized protein n=1 Tax=Georgenia subflava TaxID=1622177 RepID=A0A6N7EE40_9MICO|nr:hypothetical protein [Georgenia subflava]MPV36682.1 hypothetical protein [Georgenia subflava]
MEHPESTAVELDPEALGEEHRADEDPSAAPEEYEPELEMADATREADSADVAEQIAEVPGEDDEESDAEEQEAF